MRLRAATTILFCIIVAASGRTDAQVASIPRVGLLSLGHPPVPPNPDAARQRPQLRPTYVEGVASRALRAFQEGLDQHGYTEGRDIVIEYRWAGGQVDRLPALANELVRLNVKVIFAPGPEPLHAIRHATRTIPIVMLQGVDPIGVGIARSLARPGGNVSGLTISLPELAGKRLELLKEAVPGLSRVAVLWDVAGDPAVLREVEVSARVLGVKLYVVEVSDPSALGGAIARAVQARAQGLHVTETAMLYQNRGRIAELAQANGLAATAAFRESAEAGFLMAYGANLPDLHRQAAGYVARILKGATPAALPIEQPSRFDLTINLATARRLGLSIPPSLLLRAEKVID